MRLFVLIMVFIATLPGFGQRIAPAKLQAAIFLKLIPFHTLLGAGDFKICVIEEQAIQKEFDKMVGTKIGPATLSGVLDGAGASDPTAKVFYFGKLDAATLQSARAGKGLTLTGDISLLSEGVSLCVAIEGENPAIFLNLEASKADGIVWNPAILRVAKIKN